MEQQPPRGLCSVASSQYASGGAGVSTGQPSMRVCITSTTGSPVELTVPRGETAEALKTRISQKLRLHTDRIVLLHKDSFGKGVTDGSKLTLVPVIEAGLLCSSGRAERTVVDVLESLSEVQISDFLSGHSPLTINLGIGAHVMCVELQLSAQDHTSPNAPTSPSVPYGSPHPGCPLQATAPVCSAGPISSSPAPLSPTAASTFTESIVNPSSAAELSKPPGAVIESFVRHSPGIFSGTFSGTLAPCSQSGFSHPRRGVAIILQILNDLLRAAYHHQGAPSSLHPHRCPTPHPAEEPVMQRTEHLCIPPGQLFLETC
uniref:Midnolin n=1 Tax=Amphilophus citrinellus TaxID=61819 RepID=A0A3Q0SK94_AMPCI